MHLNSLVGTLLCFFLSFSSFSFVIFSIFYNYSGVVAYEVCGYFLPSKEHDPHRLCVSCRGKSCHQDDRCDKCHEWPEERCSSVAAYAEKLSAQREKKKESKMKFSSSSSGFSPSMPVPLGQLSSAMPGVVSTSVSSTAVCAVMFAVAGPAVTTAPITTTPAIPVIENLWKRKRVTDPKEPAHMLENFKDWWASGRSSPLLGPSSAPQPPCVTSVVPGPSLAIPFAADLSASS